MTPTGSDRWLLPSRLLYYAQSLRTLVSGISNWYQLAPLFLLGPNPKPLVVLLRNGLRFKARQAMDVWVIKETCLDREYEQASVPIQNGWTVVDIGAGIGDFAILAARQWPDCTVHAYEPLPESFKLLIENCALNGVTNVIAHPEAIASHDGPLALQPNEVAVMSGTGAASDEPSSIQVAGLSLRSALQREGIEVCDYLKIDCEGSEFDILSNVDVETLQRVRHVCLEYHDNAAQWTHADLAALLANRGFRVRSTPSRVHWYLGMLYGANVRDGIR